MRTSLQLPRVVLRSRRVVEKGRCGFVFRPKGWDSIAPGITRGGTRVISRAEGLAQAELCQAFSPGNPLAMLSQPFGLKNAGCGPTAGERFHRGNRLAPAVRRRRQ
ncbi:hypothetical protein FTUN_5174 [Frigoriglobus tundricola]|uniref:Uncharacterized protein n=1 Tax=Frigoriglobus tundricola TaxID=2774151 RepID=A0A6M5YUK9_9BACT|nr:hypothetical protein FTUN_5174 [Frigoriglobus tundricola]